MTAARRQSGRGHAGVAGADRPRTTGSAGTAPVGDTRVAVYAADDPAGFGPALQIVTDHSTDADGLRHGAAAPARRGLHRHHEPGVPGAPRPDRRTARIRPPADAGAFATASTSPGFTSQLRRRSTARRSPRSSGCCPAYWPTPVRWRWTPVRWATLRGLAARTRHRPRGPVPRLRTARTSPRCCAGSPTDTSCCSAISAAWSATARPGRPVQPSRRAAAAHRRAAAAHRSDDLLVLAQATMPSYLRYGAYPYIVVVRETSPGRRGDRAPFRRPVHRRGDERQCA